MDEARHLATLPTEYPQLGCTCLGCQHVQKASYPEGGNAPIQYGACIEAYAAYLSVYQYLPYQRLALLFKDVFNLPLSQGSLYNLLERPETIIGSDRWAAQLKTTSRAKQLCLAHLQRDLIFLEESELSPWATHCKILLQDALQAGKLAQQRGGAFAPQEAIVCRLEHRLNRLLTRTIDQEQFAQTLTFQRSMIRHRDSLLVFLYDLEVPPDNNGSKRAIRNVKVKQKVSGQFKTRQNTFCVLRSVIDTLKKRDLDVFAYLFQIMASPAT